MADELLDAIPAIVRAWITVRRIRASEFGTVCDRCDKLGVYVWERPAWALDGPPVSFSCEACMREFVLHVAPKL